MIRTFSNYKVQILEKEFVNESITYPKTAQITFFDSENKEIKTVELAYANTEIVYDKIDKNITVNLDSCYIDNFSISTYIKQRKIKEKSIKLKDFSAQNAFFDVSSDEVKTIDFSNIIFDNSTQIFSNSIFAKGAVSFQGVNFGDGGVNFDYVLFNNGNVDFSEVKFGNGDINFKNTIFGTGTKNFSNAIMGEGQKIFINTEFNDGDVFFSQCNFGSGRKSFKVARFGEGKKDFSHAKFSSGDVIFEKVEFGKGNITFRSAEFSSGLIDFTRSEFGIGEVSFENTLFGSGDVFFVGTDFNQGKVTFKLAEFNDGKIDFHYAKFGEGDIIFERTKFGNGGVDFRAAEFFEGKVTFNRAEFGDGEVSFEASELKKGTISFRRSVFGNGRFNFENAQYEKAELIIDDVNFGQGKVSFKRSKFELLSLQSCILNNYFDLRVEKCGKLDLSDTIIKDLIDIRPSEFNVEIAALDISGIRLLGRILIEWKGNNIKELIYKQDSSYRSKSEQFRVLKENYNSLGRYSDEDEAYVEFKRTEAKADLHDEIVRKPKMKVFAYLKYIAQWLVFDKMGLYATNPLRVLASVFIVYVIFSFLYVFGSLLDLGIIDSGVADAKTFSLIGRSFYMSVVIFFTIGFGDFYPLGWLRFVAGAEGFCGVFLMSYFVVAFVRKILR